MSEDRRSVRDIKRQIAMELALGAHLRIMEAGSREYRFKEGGEKPGIDWGQVYDDAEDIFRFLREKS